VLRIRIRETVPFRTQDPDPIFWVKKLQFVDADPYPGSGIFLTLVPGYEMEKKFGSGKNTPDPQNW
jgi:hypothetical protein